MTFQLTSSAFTEGGDIPTRYSCDGADQPLPVAWSGAPDGAAEFVLIMDDPDARGFVHWVVAGIPASATSIDGGMPAGAIEGRNDFGRSGYGGPCPPGGTHRYQLTLLALSAPLGLGAAASASAVRSAASGKTLGTAVLTGRYARRR